MSPFGRMSWEGGEDCNASWRTEREEEEFDPFVPALTEWWQIACDSAFAEVGEIQQTCGAMYSMWLDKLFDESIGDLL